MKRCLLSVLLVSGLSTLSFAADQNYLIAQEAKERSASQVETYKVDALVAQQNAQRLINNLTNPSIKNDSVKTPSASILIFVSFSMPEQSLEAYLRDAKKIHASVVIRGLINNSFKETFARITSLINVSQGDGMALNPVDFKRFGIQQVPSIVVISPHSNCRQECSVDRDFDVITGDIPLAAALKEIRDHGDAAKGAAGTALSEMESMNA